MNCQAVRNEILSLPDPRQLPRVLQSHVAACAGCRVWAEQAARLESVLERLPVSATSEHKKAAFLAQLAQSTTPAKPAALPPQHTEHWFRQNAMLLGGLAAALLVACGWWLFSGNGNASVAESPAPRDPFLEKIVKRDVALAQADTPAKKLRALGGLAEDISSEARGLARIATPDELKDVARWFDRVVTDGLVRQAEKLPAHAMLPAERVSEFDALASQLATAADEVDRLSVEVPAESKPALQRIADTARDGQRKLRALARREI